MPVTIKPVLFKNGHISLAGNLYFSGGYEEGRRYAALVIATPGSSVKEQIGGIYASRLADNGFIVLAFDPACQGASEGSPRGMESPALRIEDIRCAVDFLVTLPFVNADRIGLVGICAGGGYAIQAALTDHRFKALGTVASVNIGNAFRQMLSPDAVLQTLADVGRQRTSEARGEEPRLEPWIPDSLDAAKKAGITDQDMLEAVSFYRESEWRHENSNNRIHFTSFGEILGFDAFHLVSELLVQPLQIIVGGRRGSTGSYEQGEALFEMAPGADKNFFVVEGAGHYQMYYEADYVKQAVSRLASFFKARLFS